MHVSAFLLALMLADPTVAERFVRLALDCVHREYPNKLAHVLNSDADVRPARELTPAFYGCYDWHSSVHGHWQLARFARTYPESSRAAPAREALSKSLTETNIAAEVRYLEGPGRASFERPYGLAWLLQLGAELREWDAPDARRWSGALRPLEAAAVRRLTDWLKKLSHPIRTGEHSQTAFAFGLMLDWSRIAAERDFESLVAAKTREFYLNDRACPLAYEPSGEDFLSPCLAEADLVRRVLPPREFARWLAAFLPDLATLKPAVVTDPSDPRLAHLDGLNLSRAWMLEGIASRLASGDPRRARFRAAAEAHRKAGLASVSEAHYEGAHWLGTFALYLVTGRWKAEGGRQKAEAPRDTGCSWLHRCAADAETRW